MRTTLALGLVAVACRGDQRAEDPAPEPRPTARIDAARPQPTDAALAPLPALRRAGFPAAAEIIAARVAQTAPKMKLTAAAGDAAAGYLRQRLTDSADLRRLLAVMPHSTVELVRAIDERGVAPAEADRIARYLVGLCAALDFANLRRFDINHSHVTGRDWPAIDYTGEKMTWQSQQRYWSQKGVANFKTADHIAAYMRHAYRLPHFARVYRPRGRWADVADPN